MRQPRWKRRAAHRPDFEPDSNCRLRYSTRTQYPPLAARCRVIEPSRTIWGTASTRPTCKPIGKTIIRAVCRPGSRPATKSTSKRRRAPRPSPRPRKRREPHAPVCAKSTVGNASRRIINVGIVDCSYWGITGKKNLPPTTLYAQFFMTEPAQARRKHLWRICGSLRRRLEFAHDGQSARQRHPSSRAAREMRAFLHLLLRVARCTSGTAAVEGAIVMPLADRSHDRRH